jgi:monoterpene epsilon-lactone hydrolase
MTHHATAGRIAEAGHVRTLIIDYRLAPEHPFPAALEDAVTAYDWLMKKGYEKIIIAADSAGGGLALSTVVALREKKMTLPSALVCMSPLVEVEGLGESLKTNTTRG